MRVRLLLVTLAVALLVPATVTREGTARYADRDGQRLPLPTSMAALGDSITTAYNACGRYEDCPERSWSTGTDDEVNSHYNRLRVISPAIEDNATNLAASGAKVDDLARQAEEAVDVDPDYVTILIGANDACTSSEETMTSVADFRDRLDVALGTLHEGLPKTRVLVASIPDLLQLWEVEHRDRLAQVIWSLGSICQSMLQDARSVDADDVARRERVRQRVVDFNTALRDACTAYGPLCRFDGNAVFDHPFTEGEVSSWDAFHPSTSGQALLAEVTSAGGFDW